jgi:hypothetical protein
VDADFMARKNGARIPIADARPSKTIVECSRHGDVTGNNLKLEVAGEATFVCGFCLIEFVKKLAEGNAIGECKERIISADG